MDLLVRGQYVITDAAAGDAGVLSDAAVLVAGARIAAVGDWRGLRRKHPHARVVGNGKQLLMPGLVDAHSPGRALSPIQKGVRARPWLWASTSPGIRSCFPLPTTRACGCFRRRARQSPTAAMRAPETSTAASLSTPASPAAASVITYCPRTSRSMPASRADSIALTASTRPRDDAAVFLTSVPELMECGLHGEPLPRRLALRWRLAALATFFLLWSLAAAAVEWGRPFNPLFLPTPWVVIGALAELARKGQLWIHVGATLERVAIGFTTGAVAAVVLGLLA